MSTHSSPAPVASPDSALPEGAHVPRVAPAEPVPRVDSLAEFGLMISRQLTQCRRYGGRLAVLWMEAEPLAREGQVLRAELREGLLTALARRLRSRVRGTDMVLQVGENSFAVLLLDAGAAEAAIVEQRLLQALNGPYGVEDEVMYVGLSLGAAAFPEAGVRGADLAESARQDLRRRQP